MTKSCKDCLHLNVCGFRQTMDIGDGHAENCEDFKEAATDHIANNGKKVTMSLTLALIILDRLNTTERIDVARENLREAVKVVSAAAKKQLPVLRVKSAEFDYLALPVSQCGVCGHLVTDGVAYCSECGQKIDWS